MAGATFAIWQATLLQVLQYPEWQQPGCNQRGKVGRGHNEK